jgi:hypothetical protein
MREMKMCMCDVGELPKFNHFLIHFIADLFLEGVVEFGVFGCCFVAMDAGGATPSTQAVDLSQESSGGGGGEEEEFPDGCWGRLVSLSNDHTDVVLFRNEEILGRHSSCSVG